ncbi:MAG: translation initiation factor IF-2, partial [Verrucomicrobiota bacterium]
MAKKKVALDLISDKPATKASSKKSAKKAAKTQSGGETNAAVEKSKMGGKVVSEAKKVALDLGIEEEKPVAKKTTVAKEDASVFQELGKGGGVKKSAEAKEEAPAPVEVDEEGQKIIQLKPPIIVKDLADALGLKPFKIIQDLMVLDVFANQNQSVEPEVVAQICEKHGFVFEREKREKGAGVHKEEEVIAEPEPEPEPEEEKLEYRPPIVTVMGHVDHGKTSLLDAIRSAKVVDGEAGGITQHIAAYSVEHKGNRITFIDTPGHAAFTEMRARGANVTDIVILVVAANDGIMPTTVEAINHAKAAGVEIIVAVNKVDLPTADPNRVKQQLSEYDLQPEEWGGKTICVDVSATERIGIDDLLEMISLQSEVLELKADPKGVARASVIEAKMEQGRGVMTSVIVQSGTLKVGTPFICGNYSGKVKSMIDDQGKRVKSAGPSTPVEVLGFSGVPSVGDELVQMESERKAKKLSEERLDAQ